MSVAAPDPADALDQRILDAAVDRVRGRVDATDGSAQADLARTCLAPALLQEHRT